MRVHYRVGMDKRIRVGIRLINMQYVWYRGDPWGGCLYFEAWKRGASISIYKKDPKSW